MIKYKSKYEIEMMREAGKIAAQVMQELEKAIMPGVTTGALDKIAEGLIREAGGEPAFLGYLDFPASICASINNEVVHGIPGLRQLRKGDIISIDLGVSLRGYCSDVAATFGVGKISTLDRRLIDVTKQSLYEGIAALRPGAHLGDISHAVQRHVESNGFSVVYSYAGHGIGTSVHEEPLVPNFGSPGHGIALRRGIVLAIEPMVNAGSGDVVQSDDGWTVLTKDQSLSAHFEHSVAYDGDGPIILTVP